MAAGTGGSAFVLRVQGGFRLSDGTGDVALAPSARRLVAYLALQDGPAPRRQAARALWPDTDEERAAAALRTAIWRTQTGGLELIETSRTHLRLAPGVAVDLWRTIALATRVLDPSAELSDGEVQAAAFRGGDLLEDWDEPWIIRERDRVRDLRLHALEALGERLLGRRRHGEAIEAAHAAIHADPLRESAHRLLVRAQLTAGNQVAALRAYAGWRDVAKRELGCEPSAEMRALVRGLEPASC
jgi:DNA-binding SARP family transcriptional activator